MSGGARRQSIDLVTKEVDSWRPVRIRWRFHFASSGRMTIGKGGHLRLHRSSTRLVGDGGRRRERLGWVGGGGSKGWAPRA
jgi:hypothetical protein